MKYTVIHVNDRAKDNIEKIQNSLSEYEYINDIEFFDGNKGNAWDVLNHMGIPLNVWKPYDGRNFDPLPGEYGVWLSTIRCFEYMIKNNIENLLIFEDDVVLLDSFLDVFKSCIADLPPKFDFLSLYYFKEHNWIDRNTKINSNFIHRSLNQYAGAQAILYSLKGAGKILRAVKRKGVEYTCDCFIFKQSHIGILEGYSIRPDIEPVIFHDDKKIESLIDPKNIRNTKEE